MVATVPVNLVETAVDVTSGIAVGAELSCDAPLGEAARASELLSEMLLGTVGETADAAVDASFAWPASCVRASLHGVFSAVTSLHGMLDAATPPT